MPDLQSDNEVPRVPFTTGNDGTRRLRKHRGAVLAQQRVAVGVNIRGVLVVVFAWLGIKEVDDGIWLVSFMNYDLGYFDLEQKTLQPLDNPFGTRLSPMS
jgi:hypothetical protein